MFEEGFSAIFDTYGNIMADPVEWEMYGVPITYENRSTEKDTLSEWETVLETWMPRFDDAGYLEELSAIRIGDGFMDDKNAGGQYDHSDMSIAFKQNPTLTGSSIVGETKDYALVHEITHHVHARDSISIPTPSITIEQLPEIERKLNFNEVSDIFSEHVSPYAETNCLEAVAETASGITLGHDYPDEVIDAYIELGGPPTVQNWDR